jgi:hypothetical protein
MADRNPILPPASADSVQFDSSVLAQRIQELEGVGNLEAGVGITEGTVSSYNVTTGRGTATTSDGTLSFYNGVSTALVTSDVVAIAKTNANKNVVVGIITRPGSTTPVAVPLVLVPPDFPIRTDNRTFPIHTTNNPVGVYELAFDLPGAFGYGTDLMIGPKGTTASTGYTDTNALLRSTATNLNISNTVYGPRYFIDNNGRLIVINASNQLSYRDTSTGLWTTSTYTNAIYAWDNTHKILWWTTAGYTGGPFFKFAPADSAPVAMGDLGTGVSNVTNPTQRGIVAGKGKLAFQSSNNSGGVWVKNSTDANNFTSNGAAAANFVSNRTAIIDQNGNVHRTGQNTVTGNYEVRTYTHSTGITSTVDTGITYTNVNNAHLARTSTGSFVMLCVAREDVIVGGGSTTRWIPAVAVFTGTASSWVYYDTVHYVGSNIDNLVLTNLIEIISNVYRFGASFSSIFSSGAGNWTAGTAGSYFIYEFTVT